MKKCLFIILFLTVSTFVSLAQKNLDWAQFGRYAEANTQITVSPVAVFMGNSITDNWARYDKEFFEKNNFVGRGISGQTSIQMLVRFRPDVLNLKPRVVVILSGTNDIAQNLGYISYENIMGNIASMCELAKANGIKIILCSVTPTSVFKWRKEIEPAEKICELNKLLKAYAEENDIYYLDYHSALTDEKGGLPEKWSNDTCHPNLQCYREVMEPMVCDAINKVLKVKKSKRHTPAK